MAKVIEISPTSELGADDEEPLRVAAYCRVSTDHEEQSSSLEMQERYYTRLIEQTPNWINAGIFSEKVSGLEAKKRQEFRKLLRSCRKGKIDYRTYKFSVSMCISKKKNFGCMTAKCKCS